jgi:anthranilate phosphoribosyltransferase
MKQILTNLHNYKSLTEAEAYEALSEIVSGKVPESQIGAFLSTYAMRKPTVAELLGFRNAVLNLSEPVSLDTQTEPIDIVGTGGDGKNSFNISTLAAIVTAAAGCTVVKHGNYGSSSISGSSNVLERLGYRFSNDQSVLQRQLDLANVCFLHAPLFHPAMKHVANARKSLGVQSFFNLLGPLINPARPKIQLLGVNCLATMRLYQYVQQEIGGRYAIIHSLDGYDEISLTSEVKIISSQREGVFAPAYFGMSPVNPQAISAGETVVEAAGIFINVLIGRGTREQEDVVVANSAVAIQLCRPELSLIDCMAMAREAIHSNRAFSTFRKLVQL